MEELRSTEMLAREILEDARKKAAKILRAGDEAIAVKNNSWEKKNLKELKSMRDAYSKRIENSTQGIFARFPLDKRRLRSKTAEDFLIKAMNDFLISLNRERILSLLERELYLQLSGCDLDVEFDQAQAGYAAMTRLEVDEILKKMPLKPDLKWDIKEDVLEGSFDSLHKFPFIVIATPLVKITASVEKRAYELLKTFRSELAGTLLGGEVLSD